MSTNNSKSLEAKTGGGTSYKKKNHYSLKDGDFICRIVPPMTKFTDDPRGWSRFHAVHFGYKNTEGKLRMFESPLVESYDKATKIRTVEVPDAALNRLNDLQDKLEAARKSESPNPALIARLNTLVGFKGVYNIDKNHHMNVITLDGNVGELKIRHKAKLDLDREIKRLEADGFRPLSEDAGVFLVFHRDGLSKDTNFKVIAYTQKVDLPGGGKANQEVTHKITPELWTRLEEEAFNLDDLFNKPTADEVAQIVAESDLLSGKSPACDRVFDAKWKAERAEKNANKAAQNTPPVTESPKTAPNTATLLGSVGGTLGPIQGAGNGVAQDVANKAQSPATVQNATPKVEPTQAAVIAELSDAAFFEMIGKTT